MRQIHPSSIARTAMMLILSVFSLAGTGAQTIVMNENELRNALTDGANIKLATDITLSTTLIIQDNKTVTIDMSGFEYSQGKISHCYYTSTNLKGVNGDDQSGTIKVKAFKMGNVESVDYGGEMTAEYEYNGIKVYPNAMVYNGVIYTQPQYVTLNNDGGSTEPEPEITLAGMGTEGSTPCSLGSS